MRELGPAMAVVKMCMKNIRSGDALLQAPFTSLPRGPSHAQPHFLDLLDLHKALCDFQVAFWQS